MSIHEKLPQLYGAIILMFPGGSLNSSVVELLPQNAERTEYSGFVEVVYRELDNVYSWEIDDLLTQLFMICDIDLLCNLMLNYDARVLIDISFHHFTKYPSIVFEGRNMQIIHDLRANISIDPY